MPLALAEKSLKYKQLEFKARKKYFTPFEILKQVTSINAEIVAMSGPMMNPYLKGPFGCYSERGVC